MGRNCCNSAQQWLSDQQEKQQILPLSADPVLLVGDISKRWSEVDKKCKPIVNKKKPEPVKEEEATKTDEGATKESGAEDGTKTDDEASKTEEDWLYTEEADDAKKKVFVNKLSDLKDLTKAITQREVESNGRPNACNQLRILTESFLGLVNGSDEEYAHLTDEDRDEVRNCCNSAQQWLSDQQEKQQILPLSADPVLLVGDISKRWSEVEKKCKP